eukprot:1147320-Rhodomonas_salina.5
MSDAKATAGLGRCGAEIFRLPAGPWPDALSLPSSSRFGAVGGQHTQPRAASESSTRMLPNSLPASQQQPKRPAYGSSPNEPGCNIALPLLPSSALTASACDMRSFASFSILPRSTPPISPLARSAAAAAAAADAAAASAAAAGGAAGGGLGAAEAWQWHGPLFQNQWCCPCRVHGMPWDRQLDTSCQWLELERGTAA